MVAVFHLNNDALLLTQYCSVGNQTRMEALSISPKKIRFDTIDGTGLKNYVEGHMHGPALEFIDGSTLDPLWTGREGDGLHPAAFTSKRAED